MAKIKSGVTPTLQRKLDHMQQAWDVINAQPGIDSAQVCKALGVAKSTGANWIAWLVLADLVDRKAGRRIQRGSDPDTFTVCGPRPTVAPEREKPGFVPPESRIKRSFVKAKNCGMTADSLALPREFFGPARVAAYTEVT